jgi:hypothetical protein
MTIVTDRELWQVVTHRDVRKPESRFGIGFKNRTEPKSKSENRKSGFRGILQKKTEIKQPQFFSTFCFIKKSFS